MKLGVQRHLRPKNKFPALSLWKEEEGGGNLKLINAMQTFNFHVEVLVSLFGGQRIQTVSYFLSCSATRENELTVGVLHAYVIQSDKTILLNIWDYIIYIYINIQFHS